MTKSVLAAAAVLIGSVTISYAAPPTLKGDYAFTGSAACLNSPDGFNADLTITPQANVTPTTFRSFSNSFSVQGIRHFNGDGTGYVNATSVAINVPPISNTLNARVSGSTQSFSFEFTYVVNKDGSFTSELKPGTFQGKYLSGPRAGATYTVDALPFVGLVGNNGQTLTLASPAANIETVTINLPSGATITSPRICHRSRVLTWMGQ